MDDFMYYKDDVCRLYTNITPFEIRDLSLDRIGVAGNPLWI